MKKTKIISILLLIMLIPSILSFDYELTENYGEHKNTLITYQNSGMKV